MKLAATFWLAVSVEACKRATRRSIIMQFCDGCIWPLQILPRHLAFCAFDCTVLEVVLCWNAGTQTSLQLRQSSQAACLADS